MVFLKQLVVVECFYCFFNPTFVINKLCKTELKNSNSFKKIHNLLGIEFFDSEFRIFVRKDSEIQFKIEI